MMVWRSLLPNLGWILGTSILLSAWSLGSYRAACRGAMGGMRHGPAIPIDKRALFLGALLIALSQALISQGVWRQLVWFSVSGVCLYRLCRRD